MHPIFLRFTRLAVAAVALAAPLALHAAALDQFKSFVAGTHS
ncbi:MAG: hypothetical protein ACI8WM_002793, partial [Burkholderiaceae bacterium]